MKKFSRSKLMARFHDMAKRREPIIGGGAGTGISAKWEEAGGIDLIVIYNSGRYRMAGRVPSPDSSPMETRTRSWKEMAYEVLPVVKTPVLAGITGTDPFVIWDKFFIELHFLGFAGAQNFPTVGLIDGLFPGQPRGDRYGVRL